MKLWSNENEREQKIRAATVTIFGGKTEVGRPFQWNADDTVLEVNPFGVEKVRRHDGAIVFRPPGVLFEYLEEDFATGARINHLERISLTDEAPVIEGRTREITPLEVGKMIQEKIAAADQEVTSKLIEALKRDGPMRQVVISPPDSSETRDWNFRSREDMQDRLQDVFGSDLILWLVSKISPAIFQGAIKNLPCGQSEDDILKEEKEMLERDKQARRKQIEAARAYLKSL